MVIFARTVAGFSTTCTVTTTNDAGPGSLRQAILDPCGRIEFAIPGPGVHTISPASPLPPIYGKTIDGYTQPGASANTLTDGDNAVLLIELNGTNAGSNTIGLHCPGGCQVCGLVINRFSGDGISGEGCGLDGNFIGTDPTGTIPLGNKGCGLSSWLGAGVGSPNPATRNIISANGGRGIFLGQDFGSTVQGNYIGTDATGTIPLGNGGGGVGVEGGFGSLIGGSSRSAGNLISGNDGDGIWASQHCALVQGNLIGTDVSGTRRLGNSGNGLFLDACGTVGGLSVPDGNVIAFNGGFGVTGHGAIVLGNSIFAHDGLGIDLHVVYRPADGVTTNDHCDPTDFGFGTQVQNYPVLTSAIRTNGLAVAGSLDSVPNTEIHLEFFTNTACDPSGYGEGERHLGSTNVWTDADCNVAFAITFTNDVAVGEFITATATGPYGTSEFSACVPVEGLPRSPTRLRAIATSGSAVVLRWQDKATNETKFKIQQAVAADGPWSLLAITGPDVNTYTNADLNPRTTYFYRVQARNEFGRSAWSNVASATPLESWTPPPNPGLLVATAVATDEIDLTWVAVPFNTSGFKIRRALSPTGPWTWIGTTGMEITTYADKNLTPGKTFYYRVRPYNPTGGSPGNSNIADATTPENP